MMKGKELILAFLEETIGMNPNMPSYFGYLYNQGIWFPHTELDESYRDSFAKPKKCYRNAILASLVKDWEYWEGYYIFDGPCIPLEHAFNMDPKASEKPIRDHTVMLHSEGKGDLLGYFAVPIPITTDFLSKHDFRRITTPLKAFTEGMEIYTGIE